MKHRLHSFVSALSLVFMAMTAIAVIAKPKRWDFDNDRLQELPSGWISEHTGQGSPGSWKVVADPTAPSKPNVLAQLSNDSTNYRFPLVIVEKTNYKDVVLSVRFKTVSGARDQGAGLVWRFANAKNYYIVRANALENNVVLYKVQDGKRVSLAPEGTPEKTYGAKTRVPGNSWNKLGVQVKANLFTVFFNDQQLFQVGDNTFTEPGKIGLWTKADSVTYFDDLTVEGEEAGH
ncbi:MAG TPA: family 16 glycoside hydrolase [Terriglobia bacterium]|nr:family 16 glycoside hydrolase [Terriglobia bacterium]